MNENGRRIRTRGCFEKVFREFSNEFVQDNLFCNFSSFFKVKLARLLFDGQFEMRFYNKLRLFYQKSFADVKRLAAASIETLLCNSDCPSITAKIFRNIFFLNQTRWDFCAEMFLIFPLDSIFSSSSISLSQEFCR